MRAGSRGISGSALSRPLFPSSSLLGRLWNLLSSRLVTKQTGRKLLVLEDRIVLGPKKSLTLVQCAGRRYLVAVSGDTIAALQRVPSGACRPRARKGAAR